MRTPYLTLLSITVWQENCGCGTWFLLGLAWVLLGSCMIGGKEDDKYSWIQESVAQLWWFFINLSTLLRFKEFIGHCVLFMIGCWVIG